MIHTFSLAHSSKCHTTPLGLCLQVSDVIPNPLTVLLINVYVTYCICMGAAELSPFICMRA